MLQIYGHGTYADDILEAPDEHAMFSLVGATAAMMMPMTLPAGTISW